MAYTITDTPRTIDFGKNQLGFKLSVDRTRWFRFRIETFAALVVGNVVRVSWADISLVFNVVASADNSGTQLTATQDAQIINADLMKNQVFSNAWEYLLGANPSSYAHYVEKDPVNYFNVEIIGGENSFRIFYPTVKYIGAETMVAELFTKNFGDADFISQGYSFHAIDFSDVSYINLCERVIKGFKPYIPIFLSNQASEIANTMFYLKIWEYRIESGAMFQNLQETSEFVALNGKLPISEFVDFVWPTPFYLLSENTAWREMWNTAHNELTLLITSDITTFDLKVKLYFDDETDTTVDIATVNCAQNNAYFIPAGVGQLPIAANTPEGLTCYRYEVIIVNGTNTVSRSFLIKDAPDFGKVFRFMNYVGGWDCLPVLGYKSAKKKVEQFTTEKSLTPFHSETTNVQSVKYNPVEEYEMNVQSLTTAEAIMFKQLLDSPFVYLQEESTFKLIIITSSSVDVFDEENDLHNAKLNFRYA